MADSVKSDPNSAERLKKILI